VAGRDVSPEGLFLRKGGHGGIYIEGAGGSFGWGNLYRGEELNARII